MRKTLAMMTFLMVAMSCNEDTSTLLNGTTWRFDHMEILDPNDHVINTIMVDPDTIISYRIYFGSNGYVTHYGGRNGCGEFRIAGDTIDILIGYDPIIHGLCQNSNMVSVSSLHSSYRISGDMLIFDNTDFAFLMQLFYRNDYDDLYENIANRSIKVRQYFLKNDEEMRPGLSCCDSFP